MTERARTSPPSATGPAADPAFSTHELRQTRIIAPTAPLPIHVAILSDLHMFSRADPGRQGGKRETPSYLCTDADPSGAAGDPLTDLKRLISETHLKADLVLCPGDLGDIASETGIRTAWQRVQEIAQALGASCVIATPGNHDINHTHHEPDGCLKALTAFPVPEKAQRDQFWADHFTIIEGLHHRLVCLNSCGYQDSRENGRFDERARKELQQALTKLPLKPVQILLCHHHPHQHSEYQLGEHDVMKGGQLLLDMLGRHGRWLVVHGHKHHPKITRAAGHSSAPWVFAAGSLAALSNPATQGHARNQFYLLDLDPDTFPTIGWGGEGRAWDWATEDGWAPAGRDSGLPARFAFGFGADLGLLIRAVEPHIPSTSNGYIPWAELCDRVPLLRRVSPRDIEELSGQGLRIEYSDEGTPFQVSRAP